MEYTVTYDDGKVRGSAEFPAPDRLPQPGDVYEFMFSGLHTGQGSVPGWRHARDYFSNDGCSSSSNFVSGKFVCSLQVHD